MMSLIFIVNSKLSSKTDRFWKKNKPIVSSFFANYNVFKPDSTEETPEFDISRYEVVVLVGDDLFFHQMMNKLFPLITENQGKTIIAFLSDAGNSALSYGLGWPHQIKEQLALIKSKQSIPMDVIRCHYLNDDDIPSSHLILNDVLIGTPKIRSPLILKSVSHWMSLLTVLFSGRTHKQIELINQKIRVYQGEYIFSLLMLGNKITNGPKVSSKTRINLAKFEFYQLNKQPIIHLPSILPGLLFTKNEDNRYLFQDRFSELEIKGIGKENTIVADGVYLGRLPATFVLLPKAVNVISPLIAVRVMKTWKSRIRGKVAKPAGNSMFTDMEFTGFLPRENSVFQDYCA